MVIDDFSGEADEAASLAEALAPFPPIRQRQLLPRRPAASSRPQTTQAQCLCRAPVRTRGAIHRRRIRGRRLRPARGELLDGDRASRSELRTAATRAAFRFDRPEIFCAAALSARARRSPARPSTGSGRPASSASRKRTSRRFVRTAQREVGAAAAATPATSAAPTHYFEQIGAVEGSRRPADHLSGKPAPFGHHSARHDLQPRPARGTADRQHLRARTLREQEECVDRVAACGLVHCSGTSAAHAQKRTYINPVDVDYRYNWEQTNTRRQLPHRRRSGDRPAQGRLLPLPDAGRRILALDQPHRLDTSSRRACGRSAASLRRPRSPTATG